ERPTTLAGPAATRIPIRVQHSPRWETAIGIVIVMDGHSQLLQIVGTLHPVGRLAHLLHGRQKEADEHRNDGNDHQELDQGKGPPGPPPKHDVKPWHRKILLEEGRKTPATHTPWQKPIRTCQSLKSVFWRCDPILRQL